MAGAGGAPDAVLVIDDDPIIRSIVCVALEEQGLAAREAEDGLIGVESSWVVTVRGAGYRFEP